jgi:hypothetical protein
VHAQLEVDLDLPGFGQQFPADGNELVSNGVRVKGIRSDAGR